MSEKEIRLKCLEIAVTTSDADDFLDKNITAAAILLMADKIYKWVINNQNVQS